MISKRVELVLGTVSAAAGALVVAFSVFGPVICPSSAATFTGCTSVAQEQGLGQALSIFVFFGLVFAGIAFGSASHSLRGSRGGLALLGLCTVLLLLLSLMSILSIGAFLLPSVVLALIAFVTGSITPRRDRTTHATTFAKDPLL